MIVLPIAFLLIRSNLIKFMEAILLIELLV
jgi:hypothetical protein